ncbi:hypothetical protein, partial [Bartonella bovis]|uniref:hypothetical protein n=1 Tax=Bartonella bovis TaxID=155194 RepID=UPI001958932D
NTLKYTKSKTYKKQTPLNIERVFSVILFLAEYIALLKNDSLGNVIFVSCEKKFGVVILFEYVCFLDVLIMNYLGFFRYKN